MGIPRLTQDILPHGEYVVLCDSHQNSEANRIGKIVIDGPSLVYHVYYLLLKYHRHIGSRAEQSPKPRDVLIPYSVVADAVVAFLELLDNSEILVVRIFFDGGLPRHKHPVRLERLEKIRQQLEQYRLTNPTSPLIQTQDASSASIASGERIWETDGGTTPSSKLPLPPFLVPSVIERLLCDSRWCDVTDVVSGESDPYCAHLATQQNAAVLSNDSDLIVHNLGENGCLIKLDTLQLLQDETGRKILSGLCFRPDIVARGLAVLDLQLYAYQRSNDSHATSRVIAQRVRAFPVENLTGSAYLSFLEEYSSHNLSNASRYPQDLSLSGLDPRTAELVCNLNARLPPVIYLPVLFEDPSRDSPWSYGRHLRRISYSLLLRCVQNSPDASQHEHVTEYCRRGRVIKDTSLTILPQRQLIEQVENLLKNLRSGDRPQSSATSSLLEWYTFAAKLVQVAKSRDAKSCMTQIFRLMLDNQIAFEPTWDDIHVVASMQAVLYSLRMIKQVCCHLTQHFSVSTCSREQAALLGALADLPSIPDLFSSIFQLREAFHKRPLAERNLKYRSIEGIVGSINISEGTCGIFTYDHELLMTDYASGALSNTDQTWSTCGAQRRLSRKRPGKSLELPSARSRSTNPFTILDKF